jgi:hypothetical protein
MVPLSTQFVILEIECCEDIICSSRDKIPCTVIFYCLFLSLPLLFDIFDMDFIIY